MGLMLSVLIFCVGVIEAIAWTKYLRDTCTPCCYHRQAHSKRLWTSRKSFSRMRSNSEDYALHHETKCVCSDIHKVDISWPRSFSPDVALKEGQVNTTVEGTTETCESPLHASSKTLQSLKKRNSNESEDSIDELEEIGLKDEQFPPPLFRQYSEDSHSAKKLSDSENSLEDFDGFKTSKVNICWPRPFTPDDLRVIKKRNRTDSERSVDEKEENLGEARMRQPNVLRVIKSRSRSDSEESYGGEAGENVTGDTKVNVDRGSAHRDGDSEVSSLFIKQECKLEVKRDSCRVPGNFSHISDMSEVNNAILTGTYSGLPEIPENDVSENDGVKGTLSNNNSDLSSGLVGHEKYPLHSSSPLQHRDRERERDGLRADHMPNEHSSAAYGATESEIGAENNSRLAIIHKDKNSSRNLDSGSMDSRIPEESSKQLFESDGIVENNATSNPRALELPTNDIPETNVDETNKTSTEESEYHSSEEYETPVQENRSARRSDLWEESSENDFASSSPVSLEVNANNSGNHSMYNNFNSSRTSETLDEVSDISEKDFKELSENTSDLQNVMVADVTSTAAIPRLIPGLEEANGVVDSQSVRNGEDPVDSENSEYDDVFYVNNDNFSPEPEENEGIVGGPGLNRNFDDSTRATESDSENSEMSQKEYFSVCEASECLRTKSDVPSSYCGNDTDGSVYLCKAKETEEPNFEGSVHVCEPSTVVANTVAPQPGEQNDHLQRRDKEDARESEAARRESSGLKATEEPVNPARSEVDKAFWLIFSGEYTKAMSKDWHSGHFCCWQCDESLTGQRYVLRDDHPYCVKCYESVFANGCEECNKMIGIDSKDLSYKDKHWHEACFLCNKCRVSLVDKQFGSKVDKIYCGNCYDQQFASRCDGCGQIFRAGTKKMEYKTRQWHEPCFCCCVCKTPIGTKSFIPREQEIYCATCYEEKFATRCVKCNKIITSGGVTYKNEPWHRECFTCTNCNTSLAGQRFTSRDEKPYCADCFGELFAKRCTACCKPITGIGGTRFISFEDRHWHNDCFICASCKTSLVGRGFITDGDDIICPDCAKQKLM